MDEMRNIVDNEPDNYKWLVVYINHESIKRYIFSDLSQVGKIVGTSKMTLHRRFKEEDMTEINGFKIFKTPYYKSNRGGSGNNKDVDEDDMNEQIDTTSDVDVPDINKILF
jgi:hypothetical protein